MPSIPFTGNYDDLSTDRGYQFKFYCEKCGNGYMSTFQTSKMGMLGSAARVAGSLFGGVFGNVADSAYEVQRAVGGPAHDSALKDAVTEIAPTFKQCTRCGNWVCEPICWNNKAGLCEGCAPDLDEEMAAAQAEAARVAGSIFGGVFGNVANSAYEVQQAVGGAAHDSALKEAVQEIAPTFKQCTRCGNWVCQPVCWNKKAGLCETCAPDLDEEIAAAQAEAAREQVHEKARTVDWTKQRDIRNVSGAVCKSCGAKVTGGKFCPECGEPVNAKRACQECGHEAEGSPKFCPECGQRY